jgi:hypothetical protein
MPFMDQLRLDDKLRGLRNIVGLPTGIGRGHLAERIVLAKSFDLQGGPSEDWWFLVIEDGGEMRIEYKRVRHNPFKRLRKEVKTRSYSVKEFLATTRHEPRGSLRVVLKQRGIQ